MWLTNSNKMKKVEKKQWVLCSASDVAAKTEENVNEEKGAEEKKVKFKIRIQNQMKKTKSLMETIEAIGDCDRHVGTNHKEKLAGIESMGRET